MEKFPEKFPGKISGNFSSNLRGGGVGVVRNGKIAIFPYIDQNFKKNYSEKLPFVWRSVIFSLQSR